MKRTQIYLPEDLDSELRTTAAAQGRSAADVIREALRRYLATEAPKGPDPILEMAGKLSGGPRDAAGRHDDYLYRDGR